MLEVKKFAGNYKEILPLADVYMRSYNELSKGYKTKDGEIVVVIDKVLETIAQAFINDLISLGEALYFLHQAQIHFYLICVGCDLDFELSECVLPINIKLACFK